MPPWNRRMLQRFSVQTFVNCASFVVWVTECLSWNGSWLQFLLPKGGFEKFRLAKPFHTRDILQVLNILPESFDLELGRRLGNFSSSNLKINGRKKQNFICTIIYILNHFFLSITKENVMKSCRINFSKNVLVFCRLSVCVWAHVPHMNSRCQYVSSYLHKRKPRSCSCAFKTCTDAELSIHEW